MKTIIVALLALFIGTGVTFAQQNTSTKTNSGKAQKTPTGTVVKSTDKANVSATKNVDRTKASATKTADKPATSRSNQATDPKKKSSSSKKFVRVPANGQNVANPVQNDKKK
jgi:hypothetical protein